MAAQISRCCHQPGSVVPDAAHWDHAWKSPLQEQLQQLPVPLPVQPGQLLSLALTASTQSFSTLCRASSARVTLPVQQHLQLPVPAAP